MYTSENSKLRAIENQIAEQQRFGWAMLLVGVTAGLFGMHFLVSRPLTTELARMKQDLAAVEHRLQDLVGAGDQVWEANTLLSNLRAQKMQIEDARVALSGVRQLRQDVVQETENAKVTIAMLIELERLNQQVVNLRTQSADVEAAVGEVSAIQSKLIAQENTIASAQGVLDQLGTIGSTVKGAEAGLAGLVGLKTQIETGSSGIETASTSAKKLVQLEDDLIAMGAKSNDAQKSADELGAMQAKLLNGDAAKRETARQNLEGLFNMQTQIAAQTDSVRAAVQTLEVLTSFHEEIAQQSKGFEALRRNLIEIGMLETSVGKALRVLQPLVDLGNMRRLDETELREAARVILENRTARSTKNTLSAKVVPGEDRPATDMKSDLVPLPLE